MKRVIGLALVLVVLLAAPASAHVAVTPATVAPGPSFEIALHAVSSDAVSGDHAAGSEQTRATDDGVDGTDFAAFAALALAGVALVAAVAALVMGRKRIPA